MQHETDTTVSAEVALPGLSAARASRAAVVVITTDDDNDFTLFML